MKRTALGRAEILRLGALLLLVAALPAAAYGWRDELMAVVAWMGETMQEAPVSGAVVFFLASASSVLFFFLSSGLLVPSAVLVWGEWVTFGLLVAGWLSGWIAAYAVGRFLRGGPMVERRLGSRNLDGTGLLTGKLPFFFVLVVVASVPAEIVGFALGAVRYRFRLFLLAVALAEIPFAFLIVFTGEAFVRENALLFAALVALLLGVLVWQRWSARRIRGPR
jgi:uncharacterized membrane protein YdjX (TVP38/TMEM64 family)